VTTDWVYTQSRRHRIRSPSAGIAATSTGRSTNRSRPSTTPTS